MKAVFTYLTLGVLTILLPAAASAHEVYVLSDEAIEQALQTPRFSQLAVIFSHSDQFLLWAFIAIFVVLAVFFISISRNVERALDPWLAKLPRYAPLVSRVTVGISFIAAAYYGALFGPELPLTETFGVMAGAVRILLFVIGCMITVGFYTRTAALVAAALFGYEVLAHGAYMFTYLNYLGELILLLVLGAHIWAVHDKERNMFKLPTIGTRIKLATAPFAFLILRIAFGISLLYASLYAKVFHNQLALSVAYTYPDVVAFFGFDPHFLVLGAAIIEICIGMFFILGIEIRFTTLFLLFWLSLSLWYFGELVWPHFILIGIPIAFFFYGYDKYSLEGFYFKRDGREPVL